jgi:OOP family OmpA-OmpF porin
MPTVLAHRLLLGASLGLGVLDIAWLDLSLAPRVLASSDESRAGSAAIAESELAVELPAAPSDVRPSAEASPPANDTPPATAEPPRVVTAPAVDEPPAAEPSIEVAIDKQVYFASMRAELDGTAREVLDSLVHNAPEGTTFLLDGHADYRGEDAYNKKLSRRRAQTVAAYLAEHGIARQRIRIGYIGEEAPHAADELWRDRRVDIQISGGHR